MYSCHINQYFEFTAACQRLVTTHHCRLIYNAIIDDVTELTSRNSYVITLLCTCTHVFRKILQKGHPISQLVNTVNVKIDCSIRVPIIVSVLLESICSMVDSPLPLITRTGVFFYTIPLISGNIVTPYNTSDQWH